MPDIKYIPPSDIINPGAYYKPQSEFAAGVAGLEHGLAFGADLAAKIQETNRENDPEKIRADQLQRDLNNARTEELIKAAKAQYERDQIYAAQERQAAIDATKAGTEGQQIRNKYGPAREQADIDYKRASIGNMQADNELGRVNAAIEARKMYGKEGGNGYTPKPMSPDGTSSPSDLPSINQPTPVDPITASLDSEIGNYFKNQKNVSTKQTYAQVSSANSDLQKQSEQLDHSRNEQSVLDQYKVDIQDAVADIHTSENPRYGSTLDGISALGKLQKTSNDAKTKAEAGEQIAIAINKVGGVDVLHKAIEAELPEQDRAAARKILNESVVNSGDASLYSTDQKVLTDAGFSPEHVSDPDETLNKIGATIAGGIGASDDPEVDQAIGASEYLRAAREASKNGTQGFRVDNGRSAVNGAAPDTAGGDVQSQAHLVFTGDDGTVSNAPIPASPKEWADLSLVKKVNKNQAKTSAAAQGVKQDVQNLQSTVAANPNTASANTFIPEITSQSADVGRPGIRIVNDHLEDDPNGRIMINDNIGERLTNKREGPTPIEYRNMRVSQIYNAGLEDYDSPKASQKARKDAFQQAENEMRDYNRSVTAIKADNAKTDDTVKSGEETLLMMDRIVNSKYVPELLGPNNAINRGFVDAQASIGQADPEKAAFLQNLDTFQANTVVDFIKKVKGTGPANTEGEMNRISQLNITRDTSPENAKTLYKLYKAALDKTKEELWLSQRMMKDFQDPTVAVSNYQKSPDSEPLIFNKEKFDSKGNVLPGKELEPDYRDNPNYKTAKEWLGFKDPDREAIKRQAATANSPQAPAGGGGGNGGFPLIASLTGATASGASSNVPSSTTTSSVPSSTTTVPAEGADVASTSTLTSQADLAKNSNLNTNTTTVNTTVDSRFDPSVESKKFTDNLLNKINSWIHTTNVTESGRTAHLAENELERSKQDPNFRNVVEQMKQELNTEPEIHKATGLGEEKNYDPYWVDFALEAVTPQFLEDLGNSIIKNGVLPISEKVSAAVGGATGDKFYQNYFARKQARQEIFEDAKINSPYQSLFGEILAFSALGHEINKIRLGAVEALAKKFPGVKASLDYWTGGALSGKSGKFAKAAKEAVVGGAEDTAAIKLMDSNADIATNLAITTLLRGASPYIAALASSTFKGIRSLTGRLNKLDFLYDAAQRYIDRGGSAEHIKSEIKAMKQAVDNGAIETYNFKDTQLGRVLNDMTQEQGGSVAKEVNRPGVIQTGKNLSNINEQRLGSELPTRPTEDIKANVRNAVQTKVANTIDLSTKEQEAALEQATKAHEREVNKDLAAQRAKINKQTRVNVEIRSKKLKEIIDTASNTENVSKAVDDFVTEAGLDPANLKGKATGGSPTGTLADARIQKMRDLEEAIQPKIKEGYEYAEKDLDGLSEEATHKFDQKLRKDFEFAAPELIQANARRLERTTDRIEQTREVPLSDAEMASASPDDPMTKIVPTGRYELAPTFRSLDEFRQLVASSDLNQEVKNQIIDRVRKFVQEQAEATGLKKGWYDRYLDAYGKAQEAKANVAAQRGMLEDIKASMQGGLEQGKGLYNKFAGSGKANEKLESIFGKPEAAKLRKALKQHDAALEAIQKESTAKPTPITQTEYSGKISEAESNIKQLGNAKEQMADLGADVPHNFIGISADLSRAAEALGGVNQDVANALVTGKTRFTKGLMNAMGKDKTLLEESVTDWVVRKAKDRAAAFDSSGTAATTEQLSIKPEHWQNIQTIIGKDKAEIIEKYINQQEHIKRSIELIDRAPDGTKPNFFKALLRGPNPVRRILETPYFVLDFLGKAIPYSSLNRKAYNIVKNLSNPNIAEANKYAEDIANLLVDIEEKSGYKYTEIINQKYGSIREFANDVVYIASAIKFADRNRLSEPYVNKYKRQ